MSSGTAHHTRWVHATSEAIARVRCSAGSDRVCSVFRVLRMFNEMWVHIRLGECGRRAVSSERYVEQNSWKPNLINNGGKVFRTFVLGVLGESRVLALVILMKHSSWKERWY